MPLTCGEPWHRLVEGHGDLPVGIRRGRKVFWTALSLPPAVAKMSKFVSTCVPLMLTLNCR